MFLTVFIPADYDCVGLALEWDYEALVSEGGLGEAAFIYVSYLVY